MKEIMKSFGVGIALMMLLGGIAGVLYLYISPKLIGASILALLCWKIGDLIRTPSRVNETVSGGYQPLSNENKGSICKPPPKFL